MLGPDQPAIPLDFTQGGKAVTVIWQCGWLVAKPITPDLIAVDMPVSIEMATPVLSAVAVSTELPVVVSTELPVMVSTEPPVTVSTEGQPADAPQLPLLPSAGRR